MKKLKIKFWQNENVVMMKVLSRDERLRNKGIIFESDNLNMAIFSTNYSIILLDNNSISIKGDTRDNMVCSQTFNSTEDATVYIEKYQKLIRDYNASLEEEVGTIKTFTFE